VAFSAGAQADPEPPGVDGDPVSHYRRDPSEESAAEDRVQIGHGPPKSQSALSTPTSAAGPDATHLALFTDRAETLAAPKAGVSQVKGCGQRATGLACDTQTPISRVTRIPSDHIHTIAVSEPALNHMYAATAWRRTNATRGCRPEAMERANPPALSLPQLLEVTRRPCVRFHRLVPKPYGRLATLGRRGRREGPTRWPA